MSQILLNYAIPFTSKTTVAQASTAYIYKVAVVCSPIDGTTEAVTECFSMDEVALLTNNLDSQALFDGGLNSVFIVTVADLSKEIPNLPENAYFTVHISSDFTDQQIIDNHTQLPSAFVKSAEFTTRASAAEFAAFGISGSSSLPTRGQGVLFAIAKMLSNRLVLTNQQYITYSGASEIEQVVELGLAEASFDARLTFWLYDEELGIKLASFFDSKKHVTTKYIDELIKLDIQNAAVRFISANQPNNTAQNRVALQNALQETLRSYDQYLDNDQVNEIKVSKTNELFVLGGEINTTQSLPIWRMRVNHTSY